MHPQGSAPARALFPELPEISDEEFSLFQALIRNEAGIELAPTKKPMLVSRLFRRVNALKLRSFTEYYRHVLRVGESEKVKLLDAICTNETWFFRSPSHFTFVKDVVIPRWVADARASRRQPQVRIWSAGCASGEEPFSMGMLLLDALRGWEVSIMATDLSSRARSGRRRRPGPSRRARISRRTTSPSTCCAGPGRKRAR